MKLDDEEIDKLLHIVEEALKRLFWNGKVFARTQAGGQTIAKDGLASNFSTSSDYTLLNPSVQYITHPPSLTSEDNV